jgi:hypothetical protein
MSGLDAGTFATLFAVAVLAAGALAVVLFLVVSAFDGVVRAILDTVDELATRRRRARAEREQPSRPAAPALGPYRTPAFLVDDLAATPPDRDEERATTLGLCSAVCILLGLLTLWAGGPGILAALAFLAGAGIARAARRR